MAIQTVNVGTAANSNDGDPLRTAFIKINQNFTELYADIGLLTSTSNSLTPGDSAIAAAIKGNVYSTGGQLLVDAALGKITVAALPSVVPVMHQFRVDFQVDGFVNTCENMPAGWTYSVNRTAVTVTHNMGKNPQIVTYWGFTADDGYRLRYPTPGYQVTCPNTNTTVFNLNSSTTGSDSGTHALVTLLF
jgi:hypothetical protein